MDNSSNRLSASTILKSFAMSSILLFFRGCVLRFDGPIPWVVGLLIWQIGAAFELRAVMSAVTLYRMRSRHSPAIVVAGIVSLSALVMPAFL